MASITLVEPDTPPRRNRTTAWPWRPVRHVIQLAFIALLFALPLLKWFRTEANEILTVCKGHRLQCDSRADYEEAHKMIRAFGGVEESTLRRYGKDGSDYIRFVWFNGENDAVLKPHYTRAA